MDFYILRKKAGLTRKKAAVLFGVTENTIKNWEQTKPPKTVFMYLWLRTGRLDHLGPDWAGFYFNNDCICSPEGDFIYPWEIRAIRYLLAAAGINRTDFYIKFVENPANKHRRLADQHGVKSI